MNLKKVGTSVANAESFFEMTACIHAVVIAVSYE
jgi:hypothetical protein